MNAPKKARKPLVIGAAMFYLLNSAGCGYAQPTQATKAEQKGSRLEEAVSSEYLGLKEPDIRLYKLVDDTLDTYVREEVGQLDPNQYPNEVLGYLQKPLGEISQYNLDSLPQEKKEFLSVAFGELGLAHDEENNIDDAIRNYELALRLDFNNVHTQCNMGSVYRRIFKDYDKALIYYGNALEIDPDNKVANFFVNKLTQLKQEQK